MSNNTNIRKMTKQDKQAVIEMMRVFYTRSEEHKSELQSHA